jgi:hypothetical protein
MTNDLQGIELTDDETRGAGARSTSIGLHAVKLADARVTATGLLDKLAEWRAADRDPRAAGGHTVAINDRHVLVALYLLATEHSPVWITSMRDILWRRLTDDARQYLDLPDASRAFGEDHAVQAKRWLNNTWTAFHRMVDLMDPYPVPNRRRLMGRDEREAIVASRDPERQREMRERLDQYTSMWLEMTFQMQPQHIRDRQKVIDVGADQTPLPAPSRRGRSARDKHTHRELEDKETLEPDADWYPTKSMTHFDNTGKPQMDWVWGWAANTSVRVVHDASGPADVPLIAMGFSLSQPGAKHLGVDTVRIHRLIRDRGHQPGRCTTDMGYFALLKVKSLGLPMKRLGFMPLTTYREPDIGTKGGKKGALYNEGLFLCPGVPKSLADATIDAKAHRIDEATYIKRIDERLHFQLRDKERPDANGSIPKMCPALGPSATVECELRELHSRAPKGKDRPHTVLPGDFVPDKICTQTSVTFTETDNAAMTHVLPYCTDIHKMTYRRDRNTTESFNAFLKEPGYEAINDASRRRVHGLTAQQVVTTVLVVSANIRKIAAFLHEEKVRNASTTPRRKPAPRQAPVRRRDRDGKNPYRAKWPLKELPAAAPGVDPPPQT